MMSMCSDIDSLQFINKYTPFFNTNPCGSMVAVKRQFHLAAAWGATSEMKNEKNWRWQFFWQEPCAAQKVWVPTSPRSMLTELTQLRHGSLLAPALLAQGELRQLCLKPASEEPATELGALLHTKMPMHRARGALAHLANGAEGLCAHPLHLLLEPPHARPNMVPNLTSRANF
eukprot:1157570-Pelagomonas_calceolata.AAC.3